ncbi:MAG: glycosyltransferase family 2 protein [Candidatus Saccharibacteria bacterium]|nr:glycosyltransferase family 2 protein [Candidatus Saccharibacteria bacterium]
MSKSYPLVSVIVPVYNAEKFIADTIENVMSQSYGNWELLLVDDNSQDNSIKIIEKYAAEDKRIKLVKQSKNLGAAKARNKGVSIAKGRYIAFLDADDLWHPDKLTIQVAFAQKSNHPFTFTDYEFMDREGNLTGKRAEVPKRITYAIALKKSYIFTSTVLIDLQKIHKKHAMMENYKIGEDITTWWRLLDVYGDAYGVQKALSYYRRSPGSASANKLLAAKCRWGLYRKHRDFGVVKSTYYFLHYIHNAVKRRV